MQQLDVDQLPNASGFSFEFVADKSRFQSCVGSLSQACVTFSFEFISRVQPAIMGIGVFNAGEKN